MKNYKYKFSVIIPVYNVEEYLEETLESVVNQTIGFEENIQIILVNDGSPDNSEAICLKYKELYPNNIIYIKQENGGVSSARNNGINYIEGKYINFLDSDDIWDLNAFEKAYDMFEENEDLNIIGFRIKAFESWEGWTSLDYKFNKDKIINIFYNYDHIQLSVSSAFFRSNSIGDFRFDTRIKYSEDAKFIYEILLRSKKLGIISSSLYHYRKRFAGNSAIQSKLADDDWYLVTPELCYKYVYELSKKLYGYVIDFVKYYIMYEYQWRVKEGIPSNIKEEVIEKYLKISKELFQEIDDYIILEQKTLVREYKIECLKFKYGYDISKDYIYRKHGLYFNNIKVLDLTSEHIISLLSLNFNDKNIELKGTVNMNLPKEHYELYLSVNDEKILIDLKETDIYDRKIFNRSFINNLGFSIKIPKQDIKNIHFEMVYKNNYNIHMNFGCGVNAKVSNKAKIYYIEDDKIYYFYGKSIKTRENTLKNRIRFSLRRTNQLLKNKKRKIIVVRLLHSILKKINRKKIWIFTDRPMVANDNGYALFKYVCEQNNKEIKPYFAINKDSNDYEKVKKTGRTLTFNSLKYKLYFLMADKIISSQADNWVINPFGNAHIYYHDLYKGDFIFLQHGIIKDDISSWLNTYEKNMRIFVTSAQGEYDSLINDKYGYTKDEVKLTGLPRYDLLNNEKKEKLIAIMPTWRANISGKVDNKTGIRTPNPNFNKSEYFKFLSNLINDQRLLKVMKEKGYKGMLVIHPSHYANIKDFAEYSNEVIKCEDTIIAYSEIFNRASLLVSDYSSVPFDFAYLNKPVIYTQFDKEEFFSSHIYTEGYFSYEKDGLGPVVYNYEDTIKEIIKYINNDCKLDNKYQERINKFYKYHDQNNCKRVYEEILKLDKK